MCQDCLQIWPVEAPKTEAWLLSPLPEHAFVYTDDHLEDCVVGAAYVGRDPCGKLLCDPGGHMAGTGRELPRMSRPDGCFETSLVESTGLRAVKWMRSCQRRVRSDWSSWVMVGATAAGRQGAMKGIRWEGCFRQSSLRCVWHLSEDVRRQVAYTVLELTWVVQTRRKSVTATDGYFNYGPGWNAVRGKREERKDQTGNPEESRLEVEMAQPKMAVDGSWVQTPWRLEWIHPGRSWGSYWRSQNLEYRELSELEKFVWWAKWEWELRNVTVANPVALSSNYFFASGAHSDGDLPDSLSPLPIWVQQDDLNICPAALAPPVVCGWQTHLLPLLHGEFSCWGVRVGQNFLSQAKV